MVPVLIDHALSRLCLLVSSQLPACRGQLQLEITLMTDLPITLLISNSIPPEADALVVREGDPFAENCPIVDHPFERCDVAKFYDFGSLKVTRDIRFIAFLVKGSEPDRYDMPQSHWGAVVSIEHSCRDGLRLITLDGHYYDVGALSGIGLPKFIHPEELGLESYPYWREETVNAGAFPGDEEV